MLLAAVDSQVFSYRPLSYYKVNQNVRFFWFHFLYGLIITVARVERPPPWDLDPVR
jgi:hypothetical protein